MFADTLVTYSNKKVEKMKFTLRNVPVDCGTQEISYEKDNSHFDTDRHAMEEVVRNCFYALKSLGWSKISIIQVFFSEIIWNLEDLDGKKKDIGLEKAYTEPQKLCEELFTLYGNYFTRKDK